MDWLISRRHVPKDWSKKVLVVREKINEAIKDMPENKGITDLLADINYYHCKKIIDILKETEINSKNLFGQYTSQRMKDWVEIVKLYEKDNIYLGEVASLLQRTVSYEVPALKKQISKIATLQTEYDKKEINYEKMAETMMRDFNSMCKSLDIKGVKIKKELIEKSKHFPDMCLEITDEIKKLKDPVNFYINVVKSLLNPNKTPLKTLQYIMELGDDVAKGEEAYTLLGHIDTRNLILSDVLELETFLKSRIYEMTSEKDGLNLTMLPECLQAHDVKTLQNMLDKVNAVKQSLTNPTSLYYLNIMTNEKFLNQMTDKLKQKLNAHEKMLASKEAIKIQRADAIKEAESIQPKINLLIKKAKELQKWIEDDISKRYKGRPVNLIAGANIL
ncbi:conserved hypothetical protein [Pediculus humanus corporis]|uniref:Uncharacterized protein n=1 Tax=Pediculus humanus subsp. corporis TaxID=121224 RepID=E0VFE9_PEDHC|nr:uncharacterized protein Phum_PHUM156240 [Pediculus humanus corporis]EEB12105.1 conserved hypothetical protein [Pediculus humanus corporis]